MAKLPDTIRCKVTVHSRSAEGILLMAEFKMNSKNSYSFIFGPTDKQGFASINKATVISEANDTMELALMDFHSIETGFSGEVTIQAMSENNIRQALKAFKIYDTIANYPEGYETMLKTALKNPLLHDFNALHITRIE